MAAEPAAVAGASRPGPGRLLHSVATVGSMTLMSRGLGFIRDLLVADVLGAGPLADAFFVAFKLPNFLRRLFAEGAFNAGFVPMFARTLEADGPKVAKAFAEQAQAALIGILVPLVLLAIPAMPWLITIFTPGFVPADPRYAAAVELSRITFCYILFISLVALQSGVLNSMNLFGAAAASPVVLNLTMITALGLSITWLDAPAHTLAWSVAAAGVLQFFWLRFSLYRAGMALAFRWPRISPEIRRLFALIVPGAIGASAAQISALIDIFFASLLPTGAVSYLYYADRLSQLPLGVIGVAIGTALLPLLARQLRSGDTAAALRSQNLAIELALLLTLPASVALIVLAWPIIHTLFEHGAFGHEDSLKTSWTLAAYAAGLPAYVLIKVLVPGFFAREDTRTPVKVALLSLAANLAFVLTLMWPLAQVGIALATALSAWLNAGLLAWLLRRDGLLQPDARLKRRLPRIVGISLAMAAALWLGQGWLAPLPAGLSLALLVAAGGAGFLLLARLSGALDFREFRGALGRRGA
jgi:putative peptidoglycan lipid II flippase